LANEERGEKQGGAREKSIKGKGKKGSSHNTGILHEERQMGKASNQRKVINAQEGEFFSARRRRMPEKGKTKKTKKTNPHSSIRRFRKKTKLSKGGGKKGERKRGFLNNALSAGTTPKETIAGLGSNKTAHQV